MAWPGYFPPGHAPLCIARQNSLSLAILRCAPARARCAPVHVCTPMSLFVAAKAARGAAWNIQDHST